MMTKLQSQKKHCNIAFFDFDGTITRKDSLIGFIRFAVGDVKFAVGMIALSPILIAYKLRLIPNYKAKEYVLSYFFKGMSEKIFLQLSKEYSLTKIPTIIKPDALEKISHHKALGHKVVIVSASLQCWLASWCHKNKLDLISTQLEFINGNVTGKLLSENCYGREKAKRIKELYNLDDYDIIYAYGDSHGDKEMLELADKKYYRAFSNQPESVSQVR